MLLELGKTLVIVKKLCIGKLDLDLKAVSEMLTGDDKHIMRSNVFDINEPFFTDICTPYSSNGNDVILEDRHDYIYQNYSLCDKNCERPIVDLINHKVTCQCKIKGNINTQTEINFQQIDNKKYSIINTFHIIRI